MRDEHLTFLVEGLADPGELAAERARHAEIVRQAKQREAERVTGILNDLRNGTRQEPHE